MELYPQDAPDSTLPYYLFGRLIRSAPMGLKNDVSIVQPLIIGSGVVEDGPATSDNIAVKTFKTYSEIYSPISKSIFELHSKLSINSQYLTSLRVSTNVGTQLNFIGYPESGNSIHELGLTNVSLLRDCQRKVVKDEVESDEELFGVDPTYLSTPSKLSDANMHDTGNDSTVDKSLVSNGVESTPKRRKRQR